MKLFSKVFLFFLLSCSSLWAQSPDDFSKKLPSNLILGQELKWENFQLKIFTNQKEVSLVFPLEIYIVAYNPDLKTPFTGNMSLALESLAARSYRETNIKESDQIFPGIYKITYPFEQTGEYKVKANFVALNGVFTQIETTVLVKPSESLMKYQKQSFWIMFGVGIVFIGIYFVRKKKLI